MSKLAFENRLGQPPDRVMKFLQEINFTRTETTHGTSIQHFQSDSPASSPTAVRQGWGKLPQSLDCVSVAIDGKAASVYYVSSNQLNVLAPTVTHATSDHVTVTNSIGSSDSVKIDLATFQPDFTIAVEYVGAIRADGSVAAPSDLIAGLAATPIRPKENIVVYGTDFGTTTPETPAGQTLSAATPLVSPGRYQFNFIAPNLPSANYPLTASVGGVRTGKIARLRIAK